MSIDIVVSSFILIGEDFVGLGDLSKLLLGLFGVIEIFIWMPFDGEFSVGFFDLFVVGVFLYAEDLIEAGFEWHF